MSFSFLAPLPCVLLVPRSCLWATNSDGGRSSKAKVDWGQNVLQDTESCF